MITFLVGLLFGLIIGWEEGHRAKQENGYNYHEKKLQEVDESSGYFGTTPRRNYTTGSVTTITIRGGDGR